MIDELHYDAATQVLPEITTRLWDRPPDRGGHRKRERHLSASRPGGGRPSLTDPAAGTYRRALLASPQPAGLPAVDASESRDRLPGDHCSAKAAIGQVMPHRWASPRSSGLVRPVMSWLRIRSRVAGRAWVSSGASRSAASSACRQSSRRPH